MWRRARFPGWRRNGMASRWLSSSSSSSCSSIGDAALNRHPEDEGDWSYSSEWWGSDSGSGEDHRTVFRSASEHGNGVVSVLAYPSSRPAPEQWPAIETWLRQRYATIHPEFVHDPQLKILGYQWRVLRFNGNTRQSTAKIMAGYSKADPGSLFLMQQPHCLAVPYLKSMVSAGLTTLASSTYDLSGAALGKRTLRVLCVGHGGGTLPLFLAAKIKGAIVDIVDIDPVVISASIQAMGFPSSALKEASDCPSFPRLAEYEKLLWDGIDNRLFLYRSDAEDFVLNNCNTYDLVFIDAYDGNDIFPRKFWDHQGPFLKCLRQRVHPVHGTIVVNLHSDSELFDTEINSHSVDESILPMGKYMLQVCRAYKEHFGMAFCVSVPWLCNSTLVASAGVGSGGDARNLDKDSVLNALMSKTNLVEYALDIPFPCSQYIKRGFSFID